MAVRRVIYLATVLLCLVFYWAYREWLSWLLLMTVVWLPWFSLAVSLPAMLSCRLSLQCAGRVSMGEKVKVRLTVRSALPMTMVRTKLAVTGSFGAFKKKISLKNDLPTAHCGALQIKPVRTWVYDYLGLLRLPVWRKTGCTVLVWPAIVAAQMPQLRQYPIHAYKPKPGGGFGEHHELRLYRPGDDLRQIHWKLSAKAGKLMFRETMEPVKGLALVEVVLTGEPEILDKKLGQLLHSSTQLLQRDMPHTVRCLTGRGAECFPVENREDLEKAMTAILMADPAEPGSHLEQTAASWRWRIGGDSHEP